MRCFRYTSIGCRARAMLILLVTLGGGLAVAGATDGNAAPASNPFVPAARQGFGDRQNSFPWAMQWWKDQLYVGTNRAYHCTEAVAFHNAYPNWVPYPPGDPDVVCADDSADLPLHLMHQVEYVLSSRSVPGDEEVRVHL